MSFEEYERQLEMEFAVEWQESIPGAEHVLIAQGVMLSCTHGMLLCLDRPHRITYILSEIFDLSSRQGADILEISPAAFRKRLSRARERIQTFMLKNCGFVNPENPCHCDRFAPVSVQTGLINPDNLLFARHRCRTQGGVVLWEHLEEPDSLQRIAVRDLMNLLLLLGIELLETLGIYIKDNVVHVEIVIAVALIAVARKVIILDVKKLSGDTLFRIGFIILALSVRYYLIKKALPSKERKVIAGAGPAPKG